MGGSWAVLRPCWAVLGLSWGLLGLSWGDLKGPSEARKGDNVKNIENTLKINYFCFFGPSWRSSWSAHGASLGPLGPSWGHLGRIGALLGCLGGLLVAWVGFLGRHGSLGELQGGAMAAQGAPGVGAVQAGICETAGGGALRRLQKPCQTALGILPRLNAQARWRIL